MIEIILDASQIEVFEQCPRKWYLDYVRNITRKHPNPALSTGSFFHEALKFFYAHKLAGTSLEAALSPTLEYAKKLAIHGNMLDNPVPLWTEVKLDPTFYVERLKNYLFHWLFEDEQLTIVAVEQGFSTLLYEDSERRYILEGMIDLVYHQPRTGLWVRDHKTQSRAYEKYPFNHQALNYLSFTKADYFEYNYIGLQDKANANTFNREIFKPGEGVLDQWKVDVMNTFAQMELYLTSGLEQENFPRRRAACDSKFGICQFSKICEVPSNHPLVNLPLNHYKQKETKWKAW